MSYGDFVIDVLGDAPIVLSRSDLQRTNGFIYNKGGPKGWYDTSTKTQRSARPNSNGSFGVAQFLYSDIIVSMEGLYISYDKAAVAIAKARLKGKRNNGEVIRISYEDGFGVTYRDVQVANVQIAQSSDPFSFTFAIDFSCEDDARYGADFSRSTGPQTAGASGLVYPLGIGSGLLTRTNLIGDPKTTNTAKWSWPSPAVTSVSIVGGKLRLVANGTATAYVYGTVQADVPSVSGRYAITAGQRWTLRAEVTNPGASTIYVSLGCSFYNAAGAGSGVTQVSARTAITAGQTITMEYSGTAVDGTDITAGALPLLYMYSTAAGATPTNGETFDTTNWQFEIGANAPTSSPFEFWTGDTISPAGQNYEYAWGGATNSSRSIRYTSDVYMYYGDQTGVSAGRIYLTNDGEIEAWPTFYVTGGMDAGVVITDVTHGNVLRLDRNITLGQIAEFDSASGTVFIDDQVEVSADLSSDDWFSIAPHETITVQFSPLGGVTGSPTLTGIVRPTF